MCTLSHLVAKWQNFEFNHDALRSQCAHRMESTLLKYPAGQAVCALRPQSIVVKFKILPFGNKM
jgi:hypothetical protein